MDVIKDFFAQLKDNKKMYVAIICALSLLVIIVSSALITSCVHSSKHETLVGEAQRHYDSQQYERALDKLEQALKYGESAEAYLLMAECYMALGDLDSAIETLYLASYKFSDERITSRLEELKYLQENGDPEKTVKIGDDIILRTVSSLTLSSRKLTDEDIVPVRELQKLEYLTLTDNRISDLSPVSDLRENLTYLNAGINDIADLTTLSSMENLAELYLDNNPIKDFSPLYGLKNLETLSIQDISITSEQLQELNDALPRCVIHYGKTSDQVVDITVGGMTFRSDVKELDLSGLSITDISELSKCRDLEVLNLKNNMVSDLSPLSSLDNLSWLCLWGNQVEELRPLVTVTSLRYLDLESNKITDLSALSALSNLEELWLDHNKISSLSPISKLTELRRLGLKGCGLEDEDLDKLLELANLKELDLSENEKLSGNKLYALKKTLSDCTISHEDVVYTIELGGRSFDSESTSIVVSNSGVEDISDLASFYDLETLVLNGNNLSDISPLSGLRKLHTLDIGNDSSYSGQSYVSDVAPLAGLTNLQTLSLANTQVTDIGPLGTLTSLKDLDLNYCPLTSLEALASLTNLQTLSIDATGVSNITPLTNLVNLETLYARGNNISEINTLKNLKNLKTLYITSNKLSESQLISLQEALPDCMIYTDVAIADNSNNDDDDDKDDDKDDDGDDDSDEDDDE